MRSERRALDVRDPAGVLAVVGTVLGFREDEIHVLDLREGVDAAGCRDEAVQMVDVDRARLVDIAEGPAGPDPAQVRLAGLGDVRPGLVSGLTDGGLEQVVEVVGEDLEHARGPRRRLVRRAHHGGDRRVDGRAVERPVEQHVAQLVEQPRSEAGQRCLARRQEGGAAVGGPPAELARGPPEPVPGLGARRGEVLVEELVEPLGGPTNR